MGKLRAFISGILSLVLLLLGGYLLDSQRDETLQPFNEYVDFDGFVRDISDIQYYLNAAAIFNQPDKISMIQKDLDKTDTSLQNITDYYLQHIQNSLDNQKGDDLLKSEKFQELFTTFDMEKSTLLFKRSIYNFTNQERQELQQYNNELPFSNSTVELSTQISQQARKADEKLLSDLVHGYISSSSQTLIQFSFGLGSLLLIVFNCFFIPLTYSVYKKRNKKSRPIETRMNKSTHNIHLGLHCIGMVSLVCFIVMFTITISTYFDKTTISFEFLKMLKDYYLGLRNQQVVDLKVTANAIAVKYQIIEEQEGKDPNINEQSDLSNGQNNSNLQVIQQTTKQINDPKENKDDAVKILLLRQLISSNKPPSSSIPKSPPVTPSFLSTAKSFPNSNSFSRQFNLLSQQFINYLYDVNCQTEIILSNSKALQLCNKYKDNKQQLTLGYQPKTLQPHPTLKFYDMYEEQVIFDLFQIPFCRDLLQLNQQLFNEYVDNTKEDIMMFLMQICGCVGILLVCWIPFFKDSSKAIKAERRFELVNQL